MIPYFDDRLDVFCAKLTTKEWNYYKQTYVQIQSIQFSILENLQRVDSWPLLARYVKSTRSSFQITHFYYALINILAIVTFYLPWVGWFNNISNYCIHPCYLFILIFVFDLVTDFLQACKVRVSNLQASIVPLLSHHFVPHYRLFPPQDLFLWW